MILIVDNDRFAAALLSIELQHQGISHAAIAVVETARRAIAWLALHTQTPVDVVVLDRNRKVPGEDNLSLLVALRPALCPGAVVIVHSGWDEDDMVAQARHAGVDAFITNNRSHPSPGKHIAETVAMLRQAAAEGRPRPWIGRLTAINCPCGELKGTVGQWRIRMLHQLHQHIHTEHDAHLRRTVGAIENVIDDYLYPNLSVLRELLQETADPEVHDALSLVLQRTRAAMRALGDLETQVRPDTLDDPLGLPHVLAVIEEELGRSSWTGRRQFDIEGDRVAIAPAAQQEVWRITHEVLSFVMRQTTAEAMLVHLKYPDSQANRSSSPLTGSTGRRPSRAQRAGCILNNARG